MKIKDELEKCRDLSDVHDLVCHLCLGPKDSHSHIFLLCPIAARVWEFIMVWIGLSQFSACNGIIDHLAAFDNILIGSVLKKCHLLIFLAVT